MAQLKIYGSSDDLIEIDGDVGDVSEEFTAIRDFDDEGSDGGYVTVSDGTILRVVYSDLGIWEIRVIARGESSVAIEQATDAENDYTDKVTLTSGNPFRWVALAKAVCIRTAAHAAA